MRLTIAYSKIKKRNLVLIDNATYQRETLSERPIRQPLSTVKASHIHIKRNDSIYISWNSQMMCHTLCILSFDR